MISSDSHDDLEALLDGVWSRRRGELLTRAEALLDGLARAEQEPDAWQTAGAEAHKLTGSLGSLGFAEASDAAHVVELAVAAGPPADLSALRRLAAQVHAALCAATARPRS